MKISIYVQEDLLEQWRRWADTTPRTGPQAAPSLSALLQDAMRDRLPAVGVRHNSDTTTR